MAENFPSHPDDSAYRYSSGPLGPDAQMNMIGGTHHVSTKLDPNTCLTGGYQAINGDTMPSGAPVDGSPPYRGEYLPKN
jgi:hypothetical protein